MSFLLPKKIIDASNNIKNVENLFIEKDLQIGYSEKIFTSVISKGHILLDFGKEVNGGVRIISLDSVGNCFVRLRFGESVSEAMAEIGEKNATNNHSTRDMVVELQPCSDMTFGQTGFRFLKIDFLGEDCNLQIKSITASTVIDERPFLGGFECDDKTLNTIFDTAAYTLRLCIQNGYFWDGIKRDRLVWIGDLYSEMKAAHCLFGSIPETNASLGFVKKYTPLPNWMSSIPSYSLWWIVDAHDEYFISGNDQFLYDNIEYLEGLVNLIDNCVDDNGTTHYPYDFIDWPTAELENEDEARAKDRVTGMRYLTKIAIEKARNILEHCGKDVSVCDGILSKLKKQTNCVIKHKQIAGIGVMAGDYSENNASLLLDGGANGLSIFMAYPILKALCHFGKHDEALKIAKEYYNGMLSVGATTFWEDFDIKWLENCYRIDEMPVANKVDIHGDYGAYCYKGYRHSFCHGWSSSVAAYLIEEVAGIKVVEAGCKKIKITPNLSWLNYVKAKFPTPYGVLTVEHKKVDGKIQTIIDCPNGVEIIK